ncbi:PilZ domain-containing protein [Phenylobacterium sp.]|uniref:PilZ domain-containing protein n=1 Tax=Phenylobacterium sp. TaxID=1871053 RepID=UPI0035B3B871
MTGDYAERRAHPRTPVNAPARLFWGPKLAHWADGMITDLSKGGVKLEVSSVYVLPRRLVLLHYREDAAYEAILRWRRWDTAGVSFEARHDLSQPVDTWLAEVQSVWRSLAASLKPAAG